MLPLLNTNILIVAVLALCAVGDPIHVSCVGDSITAEGGNMTYPDQLQRLLGSNYVVTNQGVSGHTMLINGLCAATPGGSWRRPCLQTSSAKPCSGNCTYWDTNKFINVTISNPDIITIMLGTNDAKWCNWYGPVNGVPAGAGTQFESDYVSMIKVFKALPSKPKVYVVLPPPAISQCPATGPAGNATICLAYNISFHAVNEIFPVLQRKIAQEAGADGVVDVWSALNGTKISVHACADGIHPYSPALGVIAKTIADVIAPRDTSVS